MEIRINRKAHTVASYAEARRLWEEYRDSTGAGYSEIGNGAVVTHEGQPVARVSYNGRIWALDGAEIVI